MRPHGYARAISVAIVLAVAACTSPPKTVPLPSDPRWAGGGCLGVGTDVIIHGSATDPRVTWVTTLDGGQRTEIIWPVGYSARFVPRLEVLDATGTVVAREGDPLTGWCRTVDTPAGQPIWVDGSDVAPQPTG